MQRDGSKPPQRPTPQTASKRPSSRASARTGGLGKRCSLRSSEVAKYTIGSRVENIGKAKNVTGVVVKVDPDVGGSGPGRLTILREVAEGAEGRADYDATLTRLHAKFSKVGAPSGESGSGGARQNRGSRTFGAGQGPLTQVPIGRPKSAVSMSAVGGIQSQSSSGGLGGYDARDTSARSLVLRYMRAREAPSLAAADVATSAAAGLRHLALTGAPSEVKATVEGALGELAAEAVAAAGVPSTKHRVQMGLRNIWDGLADKAATTAASGRAFSARVRASHASPSGESGGAGRGGGGGRLGASPGNGAPSSAGRSHSFSMGSNPGYATEGVGIFTQSTPGGGGGSKTIAGAIATANVPYPDLHLSEYAPTLL